MLLLLHFRMIDINYLAIRIEFGQ